MIMKKEVYSEVYLGKSLWNQTMLPKYIWIFSEFVVENL